MKAETLMEWMAVDHTRTILLCAIAHDLHPSDVIRILKEDNEKPQVGLESYSQVRESK